MDRKIFAYEGHREPLTTMPAFSQVHVGSTPGTLVFQDAQNADEWYVITLAELATICGYPERSEASKALASIRNSEMLERSISFLVDSHNVELCLCGWRDDNPMLPSAHNVFATYESIQKCGIRMTRDEAEVAIRGFDDYKDAMSRVRCEKMKPTVLSGGVYDAFYNYNIYGDWNGDIIFETVRGGFRFNIMELAKKHPEHERRFWEYLSYENMGSWCYADYDRQKFYIKVCSGRFVAIDGVIELDFMEDIFPNQVEFDDKGNILHGDKTFTVQDGLVVL